MNALATLALLQESAPAVRISRESMIAAACFGLLTLAVSLAALPLAVRVVKFIAPEEPPPRPTWGLPHVALVLLAFLALNVLVGLLLPPREGDLSSVLRATVAIDGMLVALALLVASAGGLDGLRAFGIRNTGNTRAVVAGAAIYVVSIPGFLGVGALWNLFLTLMGHAVHPQEILTGFEALEPGRRLVPVLIGVLFIPLFEEAIFRGLLQPVLVQLLRPLAGIVVTSILFGALHGLDAFLPIFALSLLLGWMRHRTQRLSAAWAVHALHNGGQFVILYSFPDLFDSVEKAGTFLHP